MKTKIFPIGFAVQSANPKPEQMAVGDIDYIDFPGSQKILVSTGHS